MVTRFILLLAATCLVTPVHADEAVPRGRVAFFGLYLMNNAGDPDDSDERARVAMAEDQIAADLAARGFTLVDTAPVADRLAQVRNIASCNGCDMKLARELGADYSVTGEVQKTSELILSLNLFLRDVAAQTNLRHGAVDIRGNTDESWSRGYRYLLKNTIFRGEGGTSAPN